MLMSVVHNIVVLLQTSRICDCIEIFLKQAEMCVRVYVCECMCNVCGCVMCVDECV